MSGPSGVEKRHWVRLTRFCNQRCVFCLDRESQDGDPLSLDSIRRDLADGRRQGMSRVVLSGGEPTIHPEFIQIVGLARAQGYRHIQAITNGRRLCYPEFLRAAVAAGVGELTFSIHGHTPELHDRLTRVPGSFLQAVTALRSALAVPGLIVSVDVVINRWNLPVLREILDFHISLGAREFDLLALVPFGDAWKNRADLFCDFERPENLAQLRRALEVSRRPDLHLWTNRLRPEFLEGFESLIQPPEKILDEVRGRRRLFARAIKDGRPPSCAGEACERCFLSEFCRDLSALLHEGSLPARVGPLCGERYGRPKPFAFGPGAPGIESFARFYIDSRYYAKASACRSCARGQECDGMLVADIRAKGFKTMAPIEADRG